MLKPQQCKRLHVLRRGTSDPLPAGSRSAVARRHDQAVTAPGPGTLSHRLPSYLPWERLSACYVCAPRVSLPLPIVRLGEWETGLEGESPQPWETWETSLLLRDRFVGVPAPRAAIPDPFLVAQLLEARDLLAIVPYYRFEHRLL
jgi:hypothetical protein